MNSFEGKKVLLGVSGGISAYKVVELARLLVKSGADVKVIMTEAAQKFVTPLTFRTITSNPVATNLWSEAGSPIPHISLSEESDMIVVAPATANVMAKLARGIADDLLSTTLLAARGSTVIAPAMNTRMYLHPITQRNLGQLKEAGVMVVEPGEGELACGDEGVGRMAEPSEIMKVLEREAAIQGELKDKKLIVTAGPTREYIDPVRFISNPSTGLMGYTVADRAAKRGADVRLVSGPVSIPEPFGVSVERVTTAAEMKQAVESRLEEADALIMAAAVADFRPSKKAAGKLKKKAGVPEFELEPTEDVLASIAGRKGDCIVIGFAAETDDVIDNARRKLIDKGMSLVVANKVNEEGSGFASSTNMAAVMAEDEENVELSMMSKVELADILLEKLSKLL